MGDSSNVTSGKTQSMKDKKDAVARTAQIAWTIREQIRASLPTAEEQFLTVMVPGKVINFKDYISQDPNDINVKFHEAMLVDDMPATGGVQLGPTGRSIADSYATALDLLITTGTIIGIDPPKNPKDQQDPQTRYNTAMKWLGDAQSIGKTKLELYKHYQGAYTQAFEEKQKAYSDALEKSRSLYPESFNSQEKHYLEWVQVHHKVYSERIQAAYMAWVVHGYKEQAEYYFALVDTAAPNAKIEKARQSMRESVIANSDGSAEFNGVSLSPSNWATIAQRAADQTLVPHGRTPDEIQFDIDRLTFKQIALEALKNHTITEEPDEPDVDKKALNEAITTMLQRSQEYDAARKKGMDPSKKDKKTPSKAANQPPHSATAEEDKKAEEDAKAARKAAEDAKQNLAAARANVLKEQQDYTAKSSARLRAKVTKQSSDGLKEIKKDADSQANKIGESIKKLQDELDNALKQTVQVDNPIAGLVQSTDPKRSSTGDSNLANYWTRVTCEVESTNQASQQHTDSTAYTAGGAASYGLFSIAGSYSHADATSKAASQMSNLSCSISFDVMRVDIERPWLQTGVFYDSRLDAAPTAKISPGPFFLRMLIDQADEMPSDLTLSPKDKAAALKEYNLFSHYSTGFLIAANVVLELKGETSDISSYFQSDNTSASLSVGYGPFSVSGSYDKSSSDQNSSFQTTSDGCRITSKAPQIIGWVSEIVPSLPRLQEGMTPFPVGNWSSF